MMLGLVWLNWYGLVWFGLKKYYEMKDLTVCKSQSSSSTRLHKKKVLGGGNGEAAGASLTSVISLESKLINKLRPCTD